MICFEDYTKTNSFRLFPQWVQDCLRSHIDRHQWLKPEFSEQRLYPESQTTLCCQDKVFKIGSGYPARRLKNYARFSQEVLEPANFPIPKVISLRYEDGMSLLIYKKIPGLTLEEEDTNDLFGFLEVYIKFTIRHLELSVLANQYDLPTGFSQKNEIASDEDQAFFQHTERLLVWPKLERRNIVFNHESRHFSFLNIDKLGLYSEIELIRQFLRLIFLFETQMSLKLFREVLDIFKTELSPWFQSDYEIVEKTRYFLKHSDRFQYQAFPRSAVIQDILSSPAKEFQKS